MKSDAIGNFIALSCGHVVSGPIAKDPSEDVDAL